MRDAAASRRLTIGNAQLRRDLQAAGAITLLDPGRKDPNGRYVQLSAAQPAKSHRGAQSRSVTAIRTGAHAEASYWMAAKSRSAISAAGLQPRQRDIGAGLQGATCCRAAHHDPAPSTAASMPSLGAGHRSSPGTVHAVAGAPTWHPHLAARVLQPGRNMPPPRAGAASCRDQ